MLAASNSVVCQSRSATLTIEQSSLTSTSMAVVNERSSLCMARGLPVQRPQARLAGHSVPCLVVVAVQRVPAAQRCYARPGCEVALMNDTPALHAESQVDPRYRLWPARATHHISSPPPTRSSDTLRLP